MEGSYQWMYQAVLLGLLTAVSLGPVFFTIVEVSIRRGRNFGISIALGVLLSDAAIITLTFVSLGALIHQSGVRNMIGTIGAIVLILFGIYQLMKKMVVPRSVDVKKEKANYFLYLAKGFAINSLNPIVFIYWMSATSIVTLDPDFSSWDAVLFFLAAIGTNFLIDILKSTMAYRLKHVLTERAMLLLSKAVGIAMILFGLRLLYKTYFM